ncbi:carbohydrate ABC transporter permease [Tessaracoccus sp. MC1756]|uniref:carbohydrate ABC transporter permease n=1 Tax=Tessaracoccus sp. MC1756 TaxID=2760311 RepID=UPI0016033572|nr:carbohydrate ABC transporter permease [Tessaracoccus sp. MC1756]MBB1510980.1 carbohydrate ABC transporter permease [Tessaracoccus sp. MC1756]
MASKLQQDFTRRKSGAVRRRQAIRNGTRFGLIILVGLVFTFPYIWMLTASLKNNVQISDPSQTFFFEPTLANFFRVFETNNYLLYVRNSVIVALVSTGFSLLLGLPAAWAIARFGMGKVNAVILLARVVPAILLLVPWYYLFSMMGIVGTFWVLIISHMFVGLPLVTWILTGFFRSIPHELHEAGLVDGLTEFQCFLRISLPLSVPGIATAFMLATIFSWNNFLFSLVLADSQSMTLPVALYQFMAYASIDWGGLMAAAMVMSAPIAILSLFAQKYVVGGLTAGATKG